MSRRKIVFSVGGMHGGGSERQILSLLENLNRDRFEPLLYLVYPHGPLMEEIPADVPVTSFHERFGPPRGPGFLMHGKRIADMAAFFRETNAQLSYDRTFLMTMIAAAAAQKVGIPNVSTIVTDPPMGFRQVAGRFQLAKRFILRNLYRKSSRVLANSLGAARSAEQFYHLPPDLVQCFPNGVDLKRIARLSVSEIDDTWWNATGHGRRFRLVTAGRLENRKKGFHLLISAVARLIETQPDTDLRLAILGEGPCHDDLARQIRELGQTDQIRLVGFQANAPAWYRSADLFVLPSLVEGMPNVIPEAMACETPVLSSDCESGPREILADGKYGALCAVDSVDALVDGISRFLADDALAARYTSVARQHVHNTYSIESAVKRLEDIFDQVIAEHHSR